MITKKNNTIISILLIIFQCHLKQSNLNHKLDLLTPKVHLFDVGNYIAYVSRCTINPDDQIIDIFYRVLGAITTRNLHERRRKLSRKRKRSRAIFYFDTKLSYIIEWSLCLYKLAIKRANFYKYGCLILLLAGDIEENPGPASGPSATSPAESPSRKVTRKLPHRLTALRPNLLRYHVTMETSASDARLTHGA